MNVKDYKDKCHNEVEATRRGLRRMKIKFSKRFPDIGNSAAYRANRLCKNYWEMLERNDITK